MNYGYPYNPYQPTYFPQPVPDQLAQLRQQQMQPIQQPAPMQGQQVPQQTSTGNGGSGVIWVNDEQSALLYPVAPNSSVVLWDNNAPVVYLKQADATGKTSTQIFDLVERHATVRTAQAANVEYVTREEYNALSARVEALAARKTGKAKETVKEDAE